MTTISANSIYTDFNSLSLLRKDTELKPESDASLRDVAQQFESLFLHMMLKSMRSSVSESELMSSEQTGFYQEMLDQQLSTELPKQGGIGLADIIVQQLSKQGKSGETSAFSDNIFDQRLELMNIAPSSDTEKDEIIGLGDQTQTRTQFISDLVPAVNSAAENLGIKRDAILAQAILETGWGQSIIHDSEGKSSHNLFGIKADEKWQGDRVTARTFEFVDGGLRPRYEDFRAYESYEASVKDYISFLKDNSRYQEALSHGANANEYAEKIQQAGYATDPAYADKIKGILAGNTFRSLVANAEARLK